MVEVGHTHIHNGSTNFYSVIESHLDWRFLVVVVWREINFADTADNSRQMVWTDADYLQ